MGDRCQGVDQLQQIIDILKDPKHKVGKDKLYDNVMKNYVDCCVTMYLGSALTTIDKEMTSLHYGTSSQNFPSTTNPSIHPSIRP